MYTCKYIICFLNVFYYIYNENVNAQVTTSTPCSLDDIDETTTEIHLQDCQLESFDIISSTATSVALINLKLTDIPSVLEGYSSLSILDLGYNLISKYPSTLVLNELSELILRGNPLESFDLPGTALPNLKKLFLDGTRLNSVPKSIVTFSKLEVLNLNDAGIENVDVELPVTLQGLDMSNNLLTTIPSNIYKLRKMVDLNFKGNPFEALELSSDQFSFLKRIEFLYMDEPPDKAECTTPNRMESLGYRTDSGEDLRQVKVCVTSSSSDGTSIEGSTDASNSSDENNSGFPWIYILLGAIALGFIIGGIIYFSRKSKSRSNEQTLNTPIEPEYLLESNRHYTKFRKSWAGIVASNEAPKIIIPDEQNQKQSSTNVPHKLKHYEISSLYNNLLVYRINLQDLIDIKFIGSGAFAIVWLVKYRNDQLLASKRLRTDDLRVLSPAQADAFTQEIQIVSMLKHANIVEFVGVAWDGADQKINLQMLFEYMEGGDLKDCLSKTYDTTGGGLFLPRYWNPNKIAIARDVAAALVYLHSFRPPVLHRDLKARNILLSRDFSTAKLSDFGVARIRSQKDISMTGGVGTGRWLAPEVVRGDTKYSESCDIYSFGIVLMELETHDVPYSNLKNQDEETMQDYAIVYQIAYGDLDPMIGFTRDHDKGGHKTIYALAERCLEKNPAARPSAIDLIHELEQLLQQELSTQNEIVYI